MSKLFSKDENLFQSAPYIGAEILKELQASSQEKISIFDLAKNLGKTKNFSARSIYYGMIFLYSLNIIEFNEPYLIKKC